MALQQHAFPGFSRWHIHVSADWLAALALAFAVSLATPMRAAEADALQPDEVRLAQAEPVSPDQEAAEPRADEEPPEAPSPPLETGDQSDEGIEVITVEAVRQGLMEEQAASVEAFDMKELAELGAQDIGDLARVTPNLEIKSVSASAPTFFIRGVGLNDFSSNAAGAVAIYRDGVPINAPAIQLGSLFDIESVNILRGPEGYADTRNASAGAIQTFTMKPTGEYEASARTDYGINHNTRDIESALGAPIVEDWLSARGAFRYTERWPYYRNRCGNTVDVQNFNNPNNILTFVCNERGRGTSGPPVGGVPPHNLIPTGLEQSVNDQDRWAVRGLLRLQPPESDMDWLLNLHGARIDEDQQLGQTIGTVQTPFGLGPPGDLTGYTDPTIQRLYEKVHAGLSGSNPFLDSDTLNKLAAVKTLKKISYDIKEANPYQNDYDLVGQDCTQPGSIVRCDHLTGNERLRTWGGSLSGDFSLGQVAVTTITGAETYDRSRAWDFDYSPNPTVHLFPNDEAWQATQNLGFEWQPDSEWFLGTVRWGAFYLKEDLTSHSFISTKPTQASLIMNTIQDYEQDLNSTGVFGNFSWDFADGFTLDAGARYNWENKDFELSARDSNANTDCDGTNQPVSCFPNAAYVDETWQAPTGGVGITYHITEDDFVYGKYTRGWKGGQISANSTRLVFAQGQTQPITATPTVADPETIDSFEIGARGAWLEDRLQMGGNLFYYKYTDYQVFVVDNQLGASPALKIINANDARVYGAEADFRLQPLLGFVPGLLEGLVLSGRFGWIESEFLDFTDTRITNFSSGETPPQDFVFSGTVDFTGNRLPNTPRFKVSGTVEYSFDLGRWGTPSLRYDANWTDDNYFDPTEGHGIQEVALFGQTSQIPLPDYAIGQRAFVTHDLRAGYRFPDSQIEIAGWVRNIANETYKTYVADTSVFFASLGVLVGEPRTYGVSLSAAF